MASLSSWHHTLIQALLSRGLLSEHEFHAMFTEVFGENLRKSSSYILSEIMAFIVHGILNLVGQLNHISSTSIPFIAAGAPMDDNLDFKMYKVNLR
jgi:hypothetical protein